MAAAVSGKEFRGVRGMAQGRTCVWENLGDTGRWSSSGCTTEQARARVNCFPNLPNLQKGHRYLHRSGSPQLAHNYYPATVLTLNSTSSAPPPPIQKGIPP